ncbi:hypothetical protein A0H81_13639 [Grifola frondosa]|uniref:Uncharacterized protein n=1 Tax=Grifola frondosa TaxID=5627 RepID=A0A1C7LPA4_GRIFR|nr:hypothetical protein A0H81_13639 [Grifola frondosa]
MNRPPSDPDIPWGIGRTMFRTIPLTAGIPDHVEGADADAEVGAAVLPVQGGTWFDDGGCFSNGERNCGNLPVPAVDGCVAVLGHLDAGALGGDGGILGGTDMVSTTRRGRAGCSDEGVTVRYPTYAWALSLRILPCFFQ